MLSNPVQNQQLPIQPSYVADKSSHTESLEREGFCRQSIGGDQMERFNSAQRKFFDYIQGQSQLAIAEAILADNHAALDSLRDLFKNVINARNPMRVPEHSDRVAPPPLPLELQGTDSVACGAITPPRLESPNRQILRPPDALKIEAAQMLKVMQQEKEEGKNVDQGIFDRLECVVSFWAKPDCNKIANDLKLNANVIRFASNRIINKGLIAWSKEPQRRLKAVRITASESNQRHKKKIRERTEQNLYAAVSGT